jgi:hypothetical protein
MRDRTSPFHKPLVHSDKFGTAGTRHGAEPTKLKREVGESIFSQGLEHFFLGAKVRP